MLSLADLANALAGQLQHLGDIGLRLAARQAVRDVVQPLDVGSLRGGEGVGATKKGADRHDAVQEIGAVALVTEVTSPGNAEMYPFRLPTREPHDNLVGEEVTFQGRQGACSVLALVLNLVDDVVVGG